MKQGMSWQKTPRDEGKLPEPPQCCRACGRMRSELKGGPRPLLKYLADHPKGAAHYCIDCRPGGRWYA